MTHTTSAIGNNALENAFRTYRSIQDPTGNQRKEEETKAERTQTTAERALEKSHYDSAVYVSLSETSKRDASNRVKTQSSAEQIKIQQDQQKQKEQADPAKQTEPTKARDQQN